MEQNDDREEKVRASVRIPKSLYDFASTATDNVSLSVVTALKFWKESLDADASKSGTVDTIRQHPLVIEQQARIEDLIVQVTRLDSQLTAKDSLIERQSVHIQSLIQDGKDQLVAKDEQIRDLTAKLPDPARQLPPGRRWWQIWR